MSKVAFDLYLSLGMHGRLGRDVIEQVEEAKKFCKMYGVTYYSPCDDEDIRPNAIIDAKPSLRRMRWFVQKDDSHVDRCLALLLLTADKNTSGTLWEAARMRYRQRRHVLLVAPKMHCRQLVNFSTIKATKIFGDTESAVRWVSKNRKRLRRMVPKGEL